jgi:glycosyltransferase involved in cell wall biosynthesis
MSDGPASTRSSDDPDHDFKQRALLMSNTAGEKLPRATTNRAKQSDSIQVQDASRSQAAADCSHPYIYIACPWTPVGGGMYKVADYLIQAQAADVDRSFAQLRPLDTRGGSNAISSIGVLLTALCRLVRGRIDGNLVGVHVNMAERLSLFRKGLVVVTCRCLGLPVVLHLHAAQLHHFYRALPAPLRALTRWLFSLPSACIVLGTAAKQFVSQELGVPAERIAIVINGVPHPTVVRRNAEGREVQRVLFLGNLSERKGVSDLLRALAAPELAKIRIEVSVAGGGDVEYYEALAERMGIDAIVRFEGWVNQDKAARLLADADVLVLPSYDEGLPLVILEAMANGVAVICTPVGEISAAFTDGVDACFVKAGDVASIAEGLQKVLCNRELRETLEHNGRAMYERDFSLDRFFESVARIHLRHFGVCGQPRNSRVASST